MRTVNGMAACHECIGNYLFESFLCLLQIVLVLICSKLVSLLVLVRLKAITPAVGLTKGLETREVVKLHAGLRYRPSKAQ